MHPIIQFLLIPARPFFKTVSLLDQVVVGNSSRYVTVSTAILSGGPLYDLFIRPVDGFVTLFLLSVTHCPMDIGIGSPGLISKKRNDATPSNRSPGPNLDLLPVRSRFRVHGLSSALRGLSTPWFISRLGTSLKFGVLHFSQAPPTLQPRSLGAARPSGDPSVYFVKLLLHSQRCIFRHGRTGAGWHSGAGIGLSALRTCSAAPVAWVQRSTVCGEAEYRGGRAGSERLCGPAANRPDPAAVG